MRELKQDIVLSQKTRTNLPDPRNSWQSWDLTDLTKAWLGGVTNYGVILWDANEVLAGYDLRFYSTESAPSMLDQPSLEIDWTADTRTVYYLKDHLGSVRATVNDVGEVVSYDDYDAWGLILNGRSMTAQANLPNKFTGKEWDDDFGLNWNYFGARYYDPVIGRFLTVDPRATNRPGLSPYNYVQNNPLLRIDPDGRKDKKAMFRAGFRIVGGGLGYIGSKALMVGSAFAQGPTLGLSTLGIFAGIAGQAFSATEVARGIQDFKIAEATPDGMTAESFANMAEQIAREIGAGELSSELTGMLADILLGGGKDISKNMINEKFIEAILSTGQLTQDVVEAMEAWLNSTESTTETESEQSQEENQNEEI